MRKTFVILSLFGSALLACAFDAAACGRRGRGEGPAYYDGRAGYYGPDPYYADAGPPMESRRSYYYDPALPQSARFLVYLPNDDAEVWFDGVPTRQRGRERVFQTPALPSDGIYTVKARWNENGKPVEHERRIQVRGGQAHTVDFRANPPEKVPGPANPKKTSADEESPTFVQDSSQPRQGKSDGKMPLIKLDGEWTTVYAEMDGKIVERKNFDNVTIKNNVVTCRHDGKEKSFRLDFGPHNMIRCTEQPGDGVITEPTEKRIAHTHHGVYVASVDYLCLSLNKGIDRRLEGSSGARADSKGREGQPKAADRWDGTGPNRADMVIILRRAGTDTAER